MKSYQQYCSVARALDLVGDRWTLLIVRELLAMGPSRYTDLRRGLPGIATNLLADRLKTLEAEGLVERDEAPPPIAATLFRLTERGRALQGVIRELSSWGVELMLDGPLEDDARQPHWMALFSGLTMPERLTPGVEKVVAVDSEGEAVHLLVRHDGFEIRRGTPPTDPDLSLTGDAWLVGGFLTGTLTDAEATALGLRIQGVMP